MGVEKRVIKRNSCARWITLLIVWNFSSFIVLAEGVSVNITTCTGQITGSRCEIRCLVSELNNLVSFSHPVGNTVGGCLVDGSCSSDYDYLLKQDIANRVVTLTINRLDKVKHAGIWLCSYGIHDSSPISLEVYDRPYSKKPTIYVSAIEGESLTLNCDVNPVDGNYSVFWYKNDQLIDLGDGYTGGVYGNTALTINNANDTFKGSYMCSVIVPSYGRNMVNGSEIMISVVKGKESEQTITEKPKTTDRASNVSLYTIAVIFFGLFIVHVFIYVRYGQSGMEFQSREETTTNVYNIGLNNLTTTILLYVIIIVMFLEFRKEFNNEGDRILTSIIVIMLFLAICFHVFIFMYTCYKHFKKIKFFDKERKESETEDMDSI